MTHTVRKGHDRIDNNCSATKRNFRILFNKEIYENKSNGMGGSVRDFSRSEGNQ